jgi:nicotinamidase-related amidase
MSKAALLLLDLQVGILDRVKDQVPEYLPRIVALTSAARAASIPIIYVRTGFRHGYPDISPRNQAFAHVKTSGKFTDNDPMINFPDIIAPQEEDIVVIKRRVSAFAGTELELVLRSLGVERIVMCGLSTSGAVLSTLRQAADTDYVLTVLEDLCLETAAHVGVHKVLMEQVFPRQAKVVSSEDWMAELAKES